MLNNLIDKIKLFWYRIRHKVEVYPISYEQIEKILKNKFKKAFIEIEDLRYYTCDYETAKAFTKLIPVKFIKYKKEEFDCDNFSKLYWASTSLLFPRLPIGRCNVTTSKGYHSLNFIIYKNNAGRFVFTFIEPQNGKMSYFNYKPYLMVI